MCLIVDANVGNDVFGAAPNPEFVPIFDALRRATALAYYGGKLAREYAKLSKESVRMIRTLDQAGRLRKIADQSVDSETARIRQQALCRSDDPHVIAVARISGARLLCSNDKELHSDFKDAKILDGPRGSVYLNRSHIGLIRKHCQKRGN